jgi:DNA-binding LacI/PurR family transcriptional regulator
VPEDIAVVGFDDVVYSALTAPPLTTVSQPKHRMGAAAMRLLLEAMHQKERPPQRKIVLQTQLVIRESCGAHLARASLTAHGRGV